MHDERNPIPNSPDDITNEIIQRIINNNLDSLTINYEFTRCRKNDEDWDNWENEQYRNNPFWRANSVTPIKRIEFEVRLGPGVHSLACAFLFFEKLEYVDIKDTSNVTRMDAMFVGATSLNISVKNPIFFNPYILRYFKKSFIFLQNRLSSHK